MLNAGFLLDSNAEVEGEEIFLHFLSFSAELNEVAVVIMRRVTNKTALPIRENNDGKMSEIGHQNLNTSGKITTL